MPATQHELVFVMLGGRRFAVRAEVTREVLPMLAPTPVPAWPEHAVGVIDVRGELIPLLDLGPYLGRPATRWSAQHFILIVDGGSPWGCIIERVDRVEAAEVTPADELAHPVLDARPLCEGVVQSAPDPVVVLSPSGLWEQLRVGEPAATG